MTREEIIDGLEVYTIGRLKKARVDITVEELQRFIDAIKAHAQPEPCEDAVSRSWLLAEYDRQHQGPPGGARKIIETAPPVTPKQRTGKWIPSDSQCGIQCSVCGVPVDDFCHSIDYIDLDYEPNFCPNCGERMKEVSNEIN